MRSRRTTPLLLAAALLTLGAGSRPPGLADVSEVRVFDHDTHTRVVVELSRGARYQVHRLADPPRLYIDIEGTWIESSATGQVKPGGAIVKRVRGGQNELRRARVVMELDRKGRQTRTFHLDGPFRIVTDIFAEGPQQLGSEAPRATGEEAFDTRPVRRVAIDPGHGGKDPGAIGHGKLREKDVVLRISSELGRELRKRGFEVLLTRDRDVYLPLQKRTDLANAWKADLFLSIHANASPQRRTSGVETYLLDTRYDRQTARVAARENGTTVDQLSQLQKILASLRLGYQERFSAHLADTTHASLLRGLQADYKGIRDLGVKRGPFMVLFQADMPALLVEVGFVTNRGEARRLGTRDFARSAARSIAEGVTRYRDEHARGLVAGR